MTTILPFAPPVTRGPIRGSTRMTADLYVFGPRGADLVARRSATPRPSLPANWHVTFEDLAPTLRRLSQPRYRRELRFLELLQPGPVADDHLERLRRAFPAEPQGDGTDITRATLAMGARVGLATVEGRGWHATDLGRELIATEQSGDVFTYFQERWDRGLQEEVKAEFGSALMMLQQCEHARCLARIIHEPTGIGHRELMALDTVHSNVALETVAAAAALGAVVFTGLQWRPTLFGAWLEASPESPLTLPAEQSVGSSHASPHGSGLRRTIGRAA